MLEWVATPLVGAQNCVMCLSVVALTVAFVDWLVQVQDFEDILQLCNLKSV